MATVITNQDVDDLIDDESAPLTRLTDLTTLPVAESDIQLEFEIDDTEFRVWMSYEELSITALWTKKISQANGFTSILDSIKTVCDDVSTAIDGMSAPYTYADYAGVYAQLKAIRQTRGF